MIVKFVGPKQKRSYDLGSTRNFEIDKDYIVLIIYYAETSVYYSVIANPKYNKGHLSYNDGHLMCEADRFEVIDSSMPENYYHLGHTYEDSQFYLITPYELKDVEWDEFRYDDYDDQMKFKQVVRRLKEFHNIPLEEEDFIFVAEQVNLPSEKVKHSLKSRIIFTINNYLWFLKDVILYLWDMLKSKILKKN